MEVFQKNVYLLSKEESKTLTLSEIAELRKGKQYKSRVKFFQDMKDDDVRNLLENKFSPILSNKRFSCATRDGQTSARLNFHGEHRVWDGRTIKRKVQGGSALYLVLEDEPVFNSVSPARGTPSSLQGHLSSTSFYHNSKNGQTVSLTQTPQSATTVTSLKTTNSTENAVETTQWERDMNTNNPGWLGDNLNAPNSPDIHLESLEAALTVETKSGTSMLTKRNQEQNEIPSTATDALQSDDSALSSSGETVSQNGIFSAQETTQEDRVTKPIRLMEEDCLISDKSDSSGKSDSGIPSEASACPAQALNRPISLRIQDARMKPAEGPLQGGGLFRAVIDEELPRSMETGWATFGDKSVKVWVSRDGLSLFGEEIPRGDVPGPVTVTFSSLNGECVAKATYTYQERKNSTTLQIKRALDEIEECVKRLRSEPDSCDESEELAKENFHESGGDAPGPVTVTFATLNGECVAKTTSTYKKCENPMTWQITHFKRALDGVEECVKRLRSVADSCYVSNKFAEENRHDSGVTQVVKAQLGEEGYFGDTEKSDTESEDSYRMDNNEVEIEEGCSSDKCSWKRRMTKDIMNGHLLHKLIGNKWRDLARQLKFTEAVIGLIESDKGASTNECCIAVIVKWINQKGEDATVEKFAEALIKIGLRGVAEKLPGDFNDPETSVVTELQLSEISDDVGTCWRELGPKLDIPAAKIQNLDDDYRCNRDKANALLLMWKQKEGSSAIAGRLADALVGIGKKCIAEMLLGADDAKVLRCGNIPKGHVISLTVIHDLGEGLDKLMVCEDAQGNKFMVKAFNSSDNFLKLEETLVSKRYLETVVVARQESLKRYISSELQDLRLQMKKGLLACGNGDKTDGIQDASKDKTEPTSSLLKEEVDPPNDESVEKLLESCEQHRYYFQRMFDALIKLTGEVAQQNEDNDDCIENLLDFARELKQKETTLFSKIESVGTQSQIKDKQHANRVEELQKWKTQHELQFKEIEKLLSSGLLYQRTTERKPSYKGRLPSHKETVPKRQSKSLPGYGRKSLGHCSEGDLPEETRAKGLRHCSEGDLPVETRAKEEKLEENFPMTQKCILGQYWKEN